MSFPTDPTQPPQQPEQPTAPEQPVPPAQPEAPQPEAPQFAAPLSNAPQVPAPPAPQAAPQQPYGAPQPYAAQPPYGAPQAPYGAPQPGAVPQYAAYPAPPATNTMAIIAFIASFFIPLLGIILGHISLSQIKRTGENGRGLGLAGTIIGYVLTAFYVLWIGFVIVISVIAAASSSGYSYSSY